MQAGKLICFVFQVFALIANAQNADFNNYFIPSTLRIDLIQKGNFYFENMELKNCLKEPFWGGCYDQLIDQTGYGNYLIEVFDIQSDRLIYSRGFGTLFQEWRMIKEARYEERDYELTVNSPFPKQPVRIDISVRDSLNVFHKLFSFRINPDTINPICRKNYKTRYLQKSGESFEKVDIVIIPDGYTWRDKKKLLEDARKLQAGLFSYRPFSENKEKFNIALVLAYSKQRGCDDPMEGKTRETIVNTSFNTLGSDRYLMTESVWQLHDLASVVPYDQIIIMTNSVKYG